VNKLEKEKSENDSFLKVINYEFLTDATKAMVINAIIENIGVIHK
jgi:hypothetical protein